ncbi:uncharacterized protein EAF01_003011 [Botrytis porri]|uniref:Uncharacterized protein n=1 Tax=Botrytis porri TaxID=87229 RepID=A0A4Z1KT07_9HELO|nr:uncharacterized protein EAF01_003011 [Botrytis porri]KAF7909293.1 hypothetical protein EAF01_003011 [Botrytis porri]TGO86739.1 hypothetical protein BPOR_0280g00080 [Botrytis porri]
MPSSTTQMAGGPIISISDMDNFMKLGELAQSIRSQRPIKKTSSMDFDLLRASGDAARQRRGSNASEASSTCDAPTYTPRSSSLLSARSKPCASPLLRPMGTSEPGYEFMVPVHLPTPWKTTSHPASGFDGNCFGRDRDSFMGLDINVGSPFEIHSPFEIGMASELRIVDAHSY